MPGGPRPTPAPPEGRPVPPTPLPDSQQSVLATRVTLRLPAGTVRAYIDGLRKAIAPKPINVVYGEGVDQLRLTEVELTEVSLATAMNMMPRFIEGGGDSVRSVALPGAAGDTPVVVVERLNGPADQQPAPEGRVILSLRGLPLKEIAEGAERNPPSAPPPDGATVVLRAIETAIEVATVPGDPRPVVRFHADSGILAIAGTAAQCEAAREVVMNLERSMGPASRSLDGAVTQDTFGLTAASPGEVGEALRAVFPIATVLANAPRVEFVVHEEDRRIDVMAPAGLMPAVRAVVALMDRPQGSSRVVALKGEVEALRGRLENTLKELDGQRSQRNDERVRFEAQFREAAVRNVALQQEVESLRQRNDALAKEAQALRDFIQTMQNAPK
jgi:hypothetical protein